MTLINRLRLFFALMLAIAIGGAFASAWSTRRATYHLERIGLAHEAYEAHLRLSNHTYQLFKQFGDALIVGDQDGGSGETALISTIRGDIATIRLIIGREIELVGEEEIEELTALARIETQIEGLFKELAAVTGDEPGDAARDWRRLTVILDGDIDRDFKAQIDAALAEEAGEVAETRDAIGRQLFVYQALALFFAAIAAAGAIASYVALRRAVQRPMRALSEAATRFSAGDLAHRIGARGHDELADLAGTFDRMAERLAAREAALTATNAELERRVADRTMRLETLLAAARKAEADRKRLLADVSHELRTPLTVIKGEAEIALRGKDKPLDVYKEALQRAREAAGHTARLVDDLLFVARNEAQEARLQFEEFDLLDLLRAATTSNGRAVPLVTDLDAALMRGDPGRVRQTAMILLENARHYGGQTVLVRLDRTPQGYRLAVEDDGPGMDEAEKAGAFERFFRGSNAAERYGEGAGLGLPVARAIVEAHGGTIALDDRPGGGLIAAVTLPDKPPLRVVA